MVKRELTAEQEAAMKNYMNPGFGLVLMGIAYLAWWCLLPQALATFENDNRWAHNWAFAIIILVAGASWYHKSIISRVLVSVEAFMLPVTASGSVNTIIMTIVTIVVGIAWFIIVLTEKSRKVNLVEGRLQKRTINWLTMHAQVITWLLIAHMGIVFMIGRMPFENQLLMAGESLHENLGFLVNLPPEMLEIASWAFDIALISWAIIALYEQFKMGYNLQDKPWPHLSFWWTFVTMGAGLVGLAIQVALFGM
ncbi:MAG TPA: hypothetical protein VKM55_28455 [Candidatus Lokiarchaeia archaeon]|nr:hypothetical protein [Candidatus Lokiarchaeia archaeon]